MSYFKVLGSETTELIPRASEAMIANNTDKFRKEISNIYRRAMRYPVHLLIIHGDALNSDGNGFSDFVYVVLKTMMATLNFTEFKDIIERSPEYKQIPDFQDFINEVNSSLSAP